MLRFLRRPSSTQESTPSASSITYSEQISDHFKLSELRCPCGCSRHEDPEVYSNLKSLVSRLETLRSYLKKPIRTLSVVRCAEHNAKVGGAKKSYHIMGLAADIKVEGYSGEYLAGFTRGLMRAGEITPGGVGTYRAYPDMVHIDIRGQHAEWRY